jgi:hypothetical protein
MIIDKDLAVVFNFEAANAPAEVKAAAISHRENFFALKKATQQADLWKQKRKDSQLAFDASLENLNAVLANWNPEVTLEEAKPEEAGD